MERLTDKHYTGDGYYMKCSGRLRCVDNCCECEQLDEVIDRLGAYEDTGLEPKVLEEIQNEAYDLGYQSCLNYKGLSWTEAQELQWYRKAKLEGRLVVLNTPMRPLVWPDKTHNAVLCPNCNCELMGGFELSDARMFQCPHCGQPIDENRAVYMEEEGGGADV